MESKTFNLTPDTLSMIREYLAEGVARMWSFGAAVTMPS